MMDNTAADLFEGLLKELECRICVEYMLPPITMCHNGHSVCSTCRSKLQNCPFCSQHFVNTRNLALENLAAQIVFPCSYRSDGCPERHSLQHLGRHRSACSYKHISCPDSTVRGVMCPWIGSRRDLKRHFLSDHKFTAHNYTGKDTVSITNFSHKMKYFKVIFAFDEVFYRRIEVIGDTWYCTLFFVGRKEDSSKFRYSISFGEDLGATNIAFSQVTRCFGESKSEIYHHCKCVKLPIDVVRIFLDGSGTLKYCMEILEVKPQQQLNDNAEGQ